MSVPNIIVIVLTLVVFAIAPAPAAVAEQNATAGDEPRRTSPLSRGLSA